MTKTLLLHQTAGINAEWLRDNVVPFEWLCNEALDPECLPRTRAMIVNGDQAPLALGFVAIRADANGNAFVWRMNTDYSG